MKPSENFFPFASAVIRLMQTIQPDVLQAMVNAGEPLDESQVVQKSHLHSLAYALALVLTPTLQPLNPVQFQVFAQEFGQGQPSLLEASDSLLGSTPELEAFRQQLERIYQTPGENENGDESLGS